MPTDGPATSGLSALTGANVDAADFSKIVDASDHTFAGTGTDKRITEAERVLAYARLFADPVTIELFSAADALDGQAGDNKRHWHVPPHMDGKHLVGLHLYTDVASTAGPINVGMRNITQGNVDVITADAVLPTGQLHADASSVIDGAHNLLHAHDKLSWDLQIGFTGSGAIGLYVTILVGP